MAGTERQQEAITSHDTSLVVSAGAGTGKTYVLVNKYMNLLETFGEEETRQKERLSILNILTLTFTEKAAAEMKERIRNELEKRDGDFWERVRLEFSLLRFRPFIHSVPAFFVSSLLKQVLNHHLQYWMNRNSRVFLPFPSGNSFIQRQKETRRLLWSVPSL